MRACVQLTQVGRSGAVRSVSRWFSVAVAAIFLFYFFLSDPVAGQQVEVHLRPKTATATVVRRKAVRSGSGGGCEAQGARRGGNASTRLS